MSIESSKDFVSYIHSLTSKLDKNNPVPIDVYLRSMLGVLDNYSNRPPSYSVFADILERSFNAQPMAFDDAWLELTKPPFLHCQPNPDDFDNSMIDPDTNETIPKFQILLKTLMFEIAEYKRCSEYPEYQEADADEEWDIDYNDSENIDAAGCENSEQEDISSEEEYQPGWNSPDIVFYLLAMSQYIEYSQEEICDWLTITDTLEYGRICGFLDEET